MLSCRVFVLLVITFPAFTAAQYPFSSSFKNSRLADVAYKDSPVERYVNKAFGDELPKMRNDLIRRKINGEGFLERHWNALTDKNNWEVDPYNNVWEKYNVNGMILMR